MAWFKKKEKEPLVARSHGRKSVEVPVGLYAKCKGCSEIIYNQDLDKNLRVCPKCGFHYPLSATERLYLTVDAGSFEEHDEGLASVNPLSFPGYEDKLAKGRARTQGVDAVVSGLAKIGGVPVSIAITDFQFMGGSMGSVVGEKIARAAERAVQKRCALIVVSSSGGGARMQEGMFSLMQMAKTSAALAKLHEARQPYFSVITDPTAGGVAASFAMLGDLNLAEPGAMIGFAGPRVIEQTIRQKLPAGFQRSEFVLQKGFVDLIVPRPQMRDTLARILKFFKA